MAKPRTKSPPPPSGSCFVHELAGENPPSFATMESLYDLASIFYDLRPWLRLAEDQLIVVRNPSSGQLCHCSVMGALGEAFTLHAYLGDAGLRGFRKVHNNETTSAAEYFAMIHCLYVEFVRRSELTRQDRELLDAVGYPKMRGPATPVFRAVRPGFHPWFVNAEEAQILAECIRAVVVFCKATTGSEQDFWDSDDAYPLVTLGNGAESRTSIEMIKLALPPDPPMPPARASDEMLEGLRGRDFTVQGIMELDYILNGTPVGKQNERKSCMAMALAVDAQTGIVYAPEATDSRTAPGDALLTVFLKAVRATRLLPREVRVRTRELSESIAPVMAMLGVKLLVARHLPAADEARASLLAFFPP